MNTTEHGVIWKLVSELLHHHDCVILPGFGGFVCNREPARIDQLTHVILPPGKRIVFNQNLRSNDGLLAGSLANQLKISYAEAIARIEALVNAVNEELQEKKQSLIDGFGSFRLNAEANYVFVPDNKNNFLYTSYGLTPIEAAKVNGGFGHVRRTRIFKDRKETKATRNRRIRNLGPKALVLTLLIMLGTNGWIYFREHPTTHINLGQAGLQISSWFDSIFNPADHEVAVVTPIVQPLPPLVAETVPSFVPTLNTSDSIVPSTTTNEIIAIEVQQTEPSYTYNVEAFASAFTGLKNEMVVPHETLIEISTELIPEIENISTESKPETDATVDQIPLPTGNSWYIIGGVFCQERNAIRFREKLIGAGYKAEILSNSTIHCQRVSYSSYATKAEAESALRLIHQQENPEAWICNGSE